MKCTAVDEINVFEIIKSPLFINWLNSLEFTLHLETVVFQYCEKDQILNEYTLIKASTLVTTEGGKIPRFVILQGKMISILLKLKETGLTNKSFILLGEKPYIATGRCLNTSFQLHIGSNLFSKEKVSKYLFDLTGINIPFENIRNLSEEAKKTELFPLAGNSDANVTVYCADISLPLDKIMELEGKSDLLESHIIFHVFPESDVIKHMQDYVTISSYSIYRHLTKQL